MKHSRFGVVNWFVRQAIDNETIKVFGDGTILRDFLYIDDCVDAILLSGITDEAVGEIMNVGVNVPANFLQLVTLLIETAGAGHWEFAEFSSERRAQEPGDFYSDISKIKRITGWTPKVNLQEGLRKTIEYYRLYKHYYW
jgi:UDP-glucose 4-epimerase